MTTGKQMANLLSSSDEQVDVTKKEENADICLEENTSSLRNVDSHDGNSKKSSTQLHIFISTMYNFYPSSFLI